MLGFKKSSWRSFFVSHLMVCAMIFNPLAAYASQAPQPPQPISVDKLTGLEKRTMDKQDLETLQKAQKTFDPFGFEVKYDMGGRRGIVTKKGNNEIMMEVPFSSESELLRFTPKSVSQTLFTMMASAKPGEVLKHKYNEFPKEAVMFFLAVGTVTAMNLFMNYADNPLALADHIEHQLSPLGLFGFYIFMASQGITQNSLNMILKNRAYSNFIPYLSMTVGMFAQSAISAFITDPNLKACAKSVFKGNDKEIREGGEKEPCKAAFSFFVLGQRLWDLAPGLVSMLASTALAGAIQGGARWATLRWVGFDIAIWFVPGATLFQGIRYAIFNGLQIMLFFWADANFLNFYSTMAFKHFWDGISIGTIEQEINDKLLLERAAGWSPTAALGFDKTISNLKEKMSAWRMLQLQEVYASHQSWQKFLDRLGTMHGLTLEFYKIFLTEARLLKFNPTYSKLRINRPYYYMGANNSSLAELDKASENTHPEFYQYQFMVPLVKSAWTYILSLEKDEAYRKLGIVPYEFKKLKEVTAGFASSDPATQAKAMQQYNQFYRPWRNRIGDEVAPVYGSLGYTPSLNQVLNKIDSMIGAITPMLEPGRGFFALQSKFSSMAGSLKDFGYPTSVGAYRVSNVHEYLLMQMACGPEVGSSEMIKNLWGFSPRFVPPRIVSTKGKAPDFCDGPYQFRSNQIYTFPVEVDGKKYKNVVEYVAKNIRPDFFFENLEEIDKPYDEFWEKNITTVMKSAIKQFEVEYENINAKMLRILKVGGAKDFHATWNQFFNNSHASVIPAESMMQEARIYLLILGELYKNAYRANNQKELPISAYNSVLSKPIPVAQEREAYGYYPPLLYFMKYSPTYDYDDLAQSWMQTNYGFITLYKTGKTMSQVLQKPNYRALQFQRELERELEVMKWYLMSLQVDSKSIPDRNLTRGHVLNSTIEAQEKVFDDMMTRLADRMGMTDKTDNIEVRLVGEQRKVAMAALEALKSVNNEMAILIKMANAINYDNLMNSEMKKDINGKMSDAQQKGALGNQGSLMSKMGAK